MGVDLDQLVGQLRRPRHGRAGVSEQFHTFAGSGSRDAYTIRVRPAVTISWVQARGRANRGVLVG